MSDLSAILGVPQPLIAMCHLHALPGRPRRDSSGGIERIVELAAVDLDALQEGAWTP